MWRLSPRDRTPGEDRMNELERLNQQLEAEAPAAWSALSPLGRRIYYPPDIPFQAGQARGTRYNATIGQITDGGGRVLRLGPIERSLRLEEPDLNQALLYSPIDGIAELREAWAAWERPDGAPEVGLPLVVGGLTHGLSIVADLFSARGSKVFVPQPAWGNYGQIFGVRREAEMVPVEAYRRGDDGRHVWQPTALADKVAALPAGEPAVTIVNLPSNPGGYMPRADERAALVESLVACAQDRPVVVICDDAYAGLVYDPSVPSESVFWDLLGQSPQLVPVRLSGSTKEFLLFGGRVGFLTFPWEPESGAAKTMESKAKGLIRSGVGSCSALAQTVLLQAVRDGGIEHEIAHIRETLASRYRALSAALERAREDSDGLLQPLPFNAGAFALVELDRGLDAAELRLRLIEEADVGVVSSGTRFLRIAYCSLAEEDTDELVRRIVEAVRG